MYQAQNGSKTRATKTAVIKQQPVNSRFESDVTTIETHFERQTNIISIHRTNEITRITTRTAYRINESASTATILMITAYKRNDFMGAIASELPPSLKNTAFLNDQPDTVKLAKKSLEPELLKNQMNRYGFALKNITIKGDEAQTVLDLYEENGFLKQTGENPVVQPKLLENVA